MDHLKPAAAGLSGDKEEEGERVTLPSSTNNMRVLGLKLSSLLALLYPELRLAIFQLVKWVRFGEWMQLVLVCWFLAVRIIT